MSKMLAAVRSGTIKPPKSLEGAVYQHNTLLRAYMIHARWRAKSLSYSPISIN